MLRTKRRITLSWFKIVTDVPPRRSETGLVLDEPLGPRPPTIWNVT